MLLTCCVRFCLICILLIFVCIPSNQTDLEIKIQVLDSNGKESSLLYDGGTAKITCWYINPGGTHKMGTPQLSVDNGTVDGNFTQLATGNGTLLQHDISINPGALGNKYKCYGGGLESVVIQILYVLCSPMLVKPKGICPKPGDSCHITATGSTKCKELTPKSCSYGLSDSDIATRNHSGMSVLPKLKVVCPEKWRGLDHLDDTDKAYSLNGLCYSLAYEDTYKYQTPAFLATDVEKCEFRFSAYNHACGKRTGKKLAMAGWSFRDITNDFSICVNVSTPSDHYEMACSVGDGGGNVTESWRVKLEHNGTVTKKLGSAAGLSQLPTPAIADIICTAWFKHEPVLRYQTKLLLFRSDKDLKWKITEEKMEISGNRVIYPITVSVSAADGLYVCANEWKRNDRCPCTPGVPSNTQKLTIVLAFTPGEDNYIIAFYIGLFASSPKEEYVLLHERIANHTISLSGKGNVVSLIKGRNASTIMGVDRWKVCVTFGLVMAIVAAVITLVAITVMMILLSKLRSNTGRHISPVVEKYAPVPELTQKYFNETAMDRASSKSRSLELPVEQK